MNEYLLSLSIFLIRTVIYDSDKYDGTDANRIAKRMFQSAGVTFVKYAASGRKLEMEV